LRHRESSDLPDDDESHEVVLESFEITYEPLPDPQRDNMPESKIEELNRIHCLLNIVNPKRLLHPVMNLTREYPDFLPAKNWLLILYNRMGEDEMAFNYGEKLVERYPEYLFAKISLADMYMVLDSDRLDVERAGELLGGSRKTLKSVVPHRDLFHITEFNSYYFSVAKFHCLEGNREAAESMRDMLAEMEEGCPQLEELDRYLRPEVWDTFLRLAKLRKARISKKAA
jgi:hypothetical protein